MAEKIEGKKLVLAKEFPEGREWGGGLVGDVTIQPSTAVGYYEAFASVRAQKIAKTVVTKVKKKLAVMTGLPWTYDRTTQAFQTAFTRKRWILSVNIWRLRENENGEHPCPGL